MNTHLLNMILINCSTVFLSYTFAFQKNIKTNITFEKNNVNKNLIIKSKKSCHLFNFLILYQLAGEYYGKNK